MTDREKVQGRAKKFLLSSVTHVPSGLMGCASAALSWWVAGRREIQTCRIFFARPCTRGDETPYTIKAKLLTFVCFYAVCFAASTSLYPNKRGDTTKTTPSPNPPQTLSSTRTLGGYGNLVQKPPPLRIWKFEPNMNQIW